MAKILFFGSGDFALPSFRVLRERFGPLRGLVTQPDRPHGRGLRDDPSAIKAAAQALSIPVLQPENIREDAFLATARGLAPDLLAVVAYGKKLPPGLLAMPRLGCLNLHPSLLPRHRGAAPVPAAILAGDAEAGSSVIRMEAEMDAGAILNQDFTRIGPEETAGDLLTRLSESGARLLAQTIEQVEAGMSIARPQDPTKASHAPRLRKEEAGLDFAQPAPDLARRIRAMNPWPGAHTFLPRPGGKFLRLILLRGRAHARPPEGGPGAYLGPSNEGFKIAAGNGIIEVTELRPEGKAEMTGRDFLNGHPILPGTHFVAHAPAPAAAP